MRSRLEGGSASGQMQKLSAWNFHGALLFSRRFSALNTA
jgi:hypothetical protein